jgi:tetratricopeptide (TPR) repeat protein
MTERVLRPLASLALLAMLSACGSNKPLPAEAVSAPQDALRMGMQSYEDAQLIAATQLFGKALVQYRSIDDARGQVVALMDLADVALVLGEHAHAKAHLDEAARLVQRDRLTQFATHLALLECQRAAQAGDATTARAQCEAALAAADATPALKAGAHIELAKLAIAEGQASTSEGWAALRGPVAAAVAADGRPTTRARLLRLDADAARRAGRLDEAYAQLQKALAVYQTALTRPGIAASHEELAVIARAQGKPAVAADHYERALHIRLWMSDRVHGATVLEGLAAVETERGDVERATKVKELLDYMRGASNLEWRVVQQKYEAL